MSVFTTKNMTTMTTMKTNTTMTTMTMGGAKFRSAEIFDEEEEEGGDDEFKEENIGGFRKNKFWNDNGSPCGGSQEDYEKYPTTFVKEKRKDYPYMMTEDELLNRPIQSYVHFSKRAHISPMGERIFQQRLRRQLETYRDKYIEKDKKFITPAATHTDMGGGQLGIPPEKEKKFQEIYAEAIQDGITCWFTERKTEIVRMCMDFDFFGLHPITFHKMHGVAFVVQKELKRCFPYLTDETRHQLDTIVSTTSYAEKVEKGIKGIKTGFHMHWGFFVDEPRSLQIRELIIAALTKELGPRIKPENSWDELVDEAIYKNGSLRMMGSDKAENCNFCEKRRNETKKKKREGKEVTIEICNECKGEAAFGRGRPYYPLFVMDIHGNRNLEKEKKYKIDFREVVWDTSIRTSFVTIPEKPEFILYEGAPTPEQKILKRSKGKKIGEVFPAKKNGDEKGLGIQLTNADEEWEALEEYISNHSLSIYKNVYISKVKTDIQKKVFLISVKGEFSKYCHNIGREHEHNNIYFFISEDGMEQRCHDKGSETDEMKHGPCSAYRSAKIPLTFAVSAALFKKNALHLQLQNNPEGGCLGGKEVCVEDKKLKMLFIIGNELCKNLYKVQWLMEKEGDVILAKQNVTKKPKKGEILDMEKTIEENFTVRSSPLGGITKKFSKILCDLGLCEPEAKLFKSEEEVLEGEEDKESLFTKRKKYATSIPDIESKAFSTLQDIVEIMCMMTKEQLQNLII